MSKIREKLKRISPDTKIAFYNIIYWKDEQNIDKQRIDIISRLKNFYSSKIIFVIDNSNIREQHLGVKSCA